jgi:RNA polymerase sigma factor for flagellar operon FliA
MNSLRADEEAAQKHAAKRERLIEDTAGQVRYIAQRIHDRLPQHVLIDDLIQAGMVGLLDAVKRYDPDKNTQFKTYAKFRIRGAILDGLRACDWAPRELRRQGRLIEAAQSMLRNRLGRTPAEEEIADALSLDLNAYQTLLGTLNGLNLGSLERSDDHEGSEDQLSTYLPYAPDLDPFYLCAQSEMKEILALALEDLPKRERDVLVLYYFEELTLKEVGALLGVVESRVSQLRSGAILRLRSRMQELLGQRGFPAYAAVTESAWKGL